MGLSDNAGRRNLFGPCRGQASDRVLHSHAGMNRAPQQPGVTRAGAGTEPPTSRLRALVAGAAGILTFCLVDVLDPQFVRFPSIEPSASAMFNLLLELSYFLNSPYVLLPTSLVSIYLAIARRDRPNSWIFAFLAGVTIPLIVLRIPWMLRWIKVQCLSDALIGHAGPGTNLSDSPTHQQLNRNECDTLRHNTRW